MKIAVIGAGAIGSVVAGYLHKAGVEVVLVGRPDQVKAINQRGLHIIGARGEETVRVAALTRLNEKYDVVIFTVKTQDMEQAYQDHFDYLDDTFVLTTQNGVQADNILSSHIDKEKAISSIVMFGATYTQPALVTLNFDGDWIIGKPFVVNDAFVHQLADVLKKSFTVVVTQNIMGMKWLKLFVNFNNCLPALLGKSMQETFADRDFCKLSIMLLKEGYEITRKTGIELISLPQFPVERLVGLASLPVEQGAEIIHQTLTNLSKEPLYGSILQSILRKKTSEIDFINGEVVLLAENIQRKAPLNRKVVELVHEVENTGRFFRAEEIKREFEKLSAISRQSSEAVS